MIFILQNNFLKIIFANTSPNGLIPTFYLRVQDNRIVDGKKEKKILISWKWRKPKAIVTVVLLVFNLKRSSSL